MLQISEIPMCQAFGCTNHTCSHPKRSFFAIPNPSTDRERCAWWINNIGTDKFVIKTYGWAEFWLRVRRTCKVPLAHNNFGSLQLHLLRHRDKMRTALWVKTGSYDNLCLYKLIVDFSVILWQMVLKETFSSKLIFSLYNPYQIEIVQTSPLNVGLIKSE